MYRHAHTYTSMQKYINTHTHTSKRPLREILPKRERKEARVDTQIIGILAFSRLLED